MTRAAGSQPSKPPAKTPRAGELIEAAAGVAILPLHTPPLPETLPTNTFLLGGARFVVVDPGPEEGPQQQLLLEHVAERVARGDELRAIVLTHHHVDHVGALEATVRRFGVGVWAHRRTGELLERPLERALEDGDEIELDDASLGLRLRAVFTPGHAQGHLAFYEPAARALFCGDLLSTAVSMYVGSPGGSLRAYFDSLERIRALEPRIIYPSHGLPEHDPPALIERTISHRRRRLESVYSKLGSDAASADEIAREEYPDAPAKLREFVLRATRAGLEFLVEEGRATVLEGERYRRA